MADAAETGGKGKNWFMKHKILTVILAVIVIAVAASAAGGSNTKSNNSDDKDPRSSQAAKSEKSYRFNDRADKQKNDVEVMLNEAATVDGRKLTVTAADYKTSLGEFESAASGSTYVIVHVKLENVSDSTKSYNPYDFRIQTSGGQVLDPTIVTIKTLSSGDLVTGGKVEGDVAFEVPVEDGHQYLIWKPNSLKSDRAIVELK